MSPEDFRRYGHQLIDWLADYHENLANRPVMAKTEPGEIRDALPSSPPNEPEDFGAVIEDLDRLVVPGLTLWQHPRFCGYFPANALPAGILADIVSTGLGVIGLSWQSSPAVTEIEEVATDWLRQMLGLSPRLERRDPGHGLHEHAGRAHLRARAGDELRAGARRPARRNAHAARLCFGARA